MNSIKPELVMVRSSPGQTEPRYQDRLNHLRNLNIDVSEIVWLRTQEELLLNQSISSNAFAKIAPYGAGSKNFSQLILFQFFILRNLHRLGPKVIYACDLDALLPSFFWAKLMRRKIIYDQFDPYFVKLNTGVLKFPLLLIEMAASTLCDLKITANLKRIPWIFRRSWIEVPNYFLIAAPKIQSKPDSYVLSYGGVLQNDRGLLQVAEILSRRKNWIFEIYGDGPIKDQLNKLAQQFTNIQISGKISHDILMEKVASSSAYLALYNPKFQHNRFTASNKIYEAAQLGIPVITSKGTSIGDTVHKFQLGWVVDFENLSALSGVLDNLERWDLNNWKAFHGKCKLFLNQKNKFRELNILGEKVLSIVKG